MAKIDMVEDDIPLVLAFIFSQKKSPTNQWHEARFNPMRHEILGQMPIATRWLFNATVMLSKASIVGHAKLKTLAGNSSEKKTLQTVLARIKVRGDAFDKLLWAQLCDEFPTCFNYPGKIILANWQFGVLKTTRRAAEEEFPFVKRSPNPADVRTFPPATS